MQPFTCPHCGAHDYTVILTGCNVANATVEEAFAWDEDSREYTSTGSVIVEHQGIENEGGTALCSTCEQDVSDAVAAYEESLPASNGDQG